MNTTATLTTAAGCLLLAMTGAGNANAAEYWAACSNCGTSTKGFAMGVPGEAPGSHTVNVYDDNSEALTSYSVFIYYDFEFRGWSRFAREQQPSLEALNLLDEIREAERFVTALAGLLNAVRMDIPSVQDYLLSGGALDTQVANNLLNGLHQQGFLDRLRNTAVLLTTTAGKVISKRNVEATFRVTFDDGSSMLVTAKFIANDLNDPIIDYVEGSARLADGTVLPETEADVNTLIVATNNVATINALRQWVSLIWGRTISVTPGQREGVNYEYLFQCDENECVLTAREST